MQETQDISSNRESSVFLRYIKHNIKKILIVSLCCSIIGILISYILPHTYSSTVMVLPVEQKNGGSGIASLLSGNLPSGLGGIMGANESKNSFLSPELLLSRTLSEMIEKQGNLKKYDQYLSIPDKDKISELRKSLSIDTRRSGIVLLEANWSTGFFPSYQDKEQSALLASIIANQAAFGIDIISKNKSTSTAKRARVFIDKIMAENKASLDSHYLALQQFQKQNKIVELEEQGKLIIGNAVLMGTELAKAQIELDIAKQQFQNDAPVVTILQKKVSSLQKQFSLVQSGGNSSDQFSINLKKIPELGKKYVIMLRDIKIMEQINAYLQTQRTQEYIQEVRDFPEIQIVEKAIPESKHIFPKRSIIAIIFFFLGIILSVFYGIVKASRQSTFPSLQKK